MPTYQQLTGIFSNMTVLVPVIGIIALVLGFRFIRTFVDLFKLMIVFGIAAGLLIAFGRLTGAVSDWQQSVAQPKSVHHNAPGILPSLNSSNPNTMNPVVHLNPAIVALAILVAVVWIIGYLVLRATPPTTRANMRKRLRSFFTFGGATAKVRDDRSEYDYVDVELGVSKETGKAITVAGKDRFIGTLIVGAPGTGKTSRILTKGAYQDLANIAHGVPMDLFVMDPDGGLVDDTLSMAERLQIKNTMVIDLREAGGHPNTVSFSPFYGGKIHTIVDNVRAVLREQMGSQEAFFQNAQDDLVRTVIQVQLPLWPDTDFIQFADLATDPIHLRGICQMLYNHVNPETVVARKGKKDDDDLSIDPEYAHEIAYVRARYDELEQHVQSSVLSAARSFLQDTRTEQKLENLEKVTKGLKLVLNELSTNPVLRQVLGKSSLPSLNFGEFLSAGRDEPGRVIAIVTGNTPIGDLFGKLILVSLKMYLLTRPGNENTRRPLYRWIDEFHRYATESIQDEFVQARKYRLGSTIAIQERSQLELKTSRDFLRVAEVGSRNKIYFPSLSAADAQFLEKSLGTVINMQVTHSENRLGVFVLDDRRPDRKISTREKVDPRFKLEDLQFGLTKDEAIFAMTVDNQAQVPEIGVTSYASDWVKQNKKLFTITKPKKEKERMQLRLPKWQADKPSTTDMASAVVEPAPSRTVEKPTHDKMAMESGYVRQEAKRDDVISIAMLTQSPRSDSTDGTTIVEPELTSKPADEVPVVAQRTSLRRKQSQVEDVETGNEEKTCPNCRVGKLRLTEDLRRWRCSAPSCGFERKNRSAAVAQNVTSN